MSDPITPDEEQQMRDILEQFYGPQVQKWKISVKTFVLMEKLIDETKGCDRLMDMVPRPYAGGGVAKWAKKQARKFLLRKLKGNEGKHYITCMKVVAAKMRNDFYAAGIGL
jgi:hypothetical protein